MSESGVSVATLLSEAAGSPDLELTILAGRAGLARRVTNLHVQKTGLALAGFDEFLRPGRILVFGQSEMRYLQGLPPDARRAAIRRVFDRGIPCVLVTDAFPPLAELVDEADRTGVPVLQTPIAIARMTVRLETHLAVRGMVHGVLLDILGLGVLVVGERVPRIRMPVAPGRNVAILVEVAARNQLLRARGHHAARALAARLDRALLHDDATPLGAAAPAAAGRLDGAEDEADYGDEDDA